MLNDKISCFSHHLVFRPALVKVYYFLVFCFKGSCLKTGSTVVPTSNLSTPRYSLQPFSLGYFNRYPFPNRVNIWFISTLPSLLSRENTFFQALPGLHHTFNFPWRSIFFLVLFSEKKYICRSGWESCVHFLWRVNPLWYILFSNKNELFYLFLLSLVENTQYVKIYM